MDKASLEVMAAAQGEDLDEIIDDLTSYTPDEIRDHYQEHKKDVHGAILDRDRRSVLDYADWMEEEGVTNFNDETVEEHLRYLIRDGYAKGTINSRYYGLTNFAENQLSETANSLAREISHSEVATDEMKKQGIEQDGRIGTGARPISKEEKEAMKEEAPTPRTELMVELFWQCGFRAEELATIEVERIDLDEREIEVDTVKRDGHTRSVSFDLELKFQLDNYLSSYRPKYGRSSPYLFVSQRSDHPYPQNISRTIKDLADDAGVQEYAEMQNGAKRADITPHSFRKSLGIRMDENGAGMKEIAEELGHSNTGTVSTYLDIS